MIKTALWIFGGILLGLIIHLTLILSLPQIVPNNVWSIFEKIGKPGELITIARPKQQEANILRLDPELAYAVCRFDLSIGPGIINGKLPNDFWSVGVFDKAGVAIYSTTNRSGGGNTLDIGIFNPAQTRLLAEQKIELESGILIVKVPRDEVFIVIRLAVPHPAMWQRYKETLEKLHCSHVGQNQ
jgi:uncharacterized membrane protein